MSGKVWKGSEADRKLLLRLGRRYRAIPGDHFDNYLKLVLGLAIDALAREFMEPEAYKGAGRTHIEYARARR